MSAGLRFQALQELRKLLRWESANISRRKKPTFSHGRTLHRMFVAQQHPVAWEIMSQGTTVSCALNNGNTRANPQDDKQLLMAFKVTVRTDMKLWNVPYDR